MSEPNRGALCASLLAAARLSAALPARAQGSAWAVHSGTAPAPATVTDPPDALAPDEIERTVTLLRKARQIDDGTQVPGYVIRSARWHCDGSGVVAPDSSTPGGGRRALTRPGESRALAVVVPGCLGYVH